MRAKSTQLLFLIIIGIAVISSSCEAPKAFPCEKGVGERVTETLTLDPFDKIILDAPADVYISEGQYLNVEITAQENVLETIETMVTGDILEIRNERCIRQSKTIEVNITLPAVSLIEVKGSGDVYGLDRFTTDNIDLVVSGSGSIEWLADANSVNTEIRGSGDIVLDADVAELYSKLFGSGDLGLSGDADLHNIDLDGTGSVNGFEMQTLETFINIAGSGNCEC